jgi:hypothetical protein
VAAAGREVQSGVLAAVRVVGLELVLLLRRGRERERERERERRNE